MANQTETTPVEDISESKSLIKVIKREISDDPATVACEKIPDEERPTSKRKLSSNGSSEDDDSKVLKWEGDSFDETDQTVTDNDLSCNEDEGSSHSGDSDDSADDPQVMDDILSVKKMELLQHPQVIAFIQEKMDQAKKAKGK